MAKERGDSQVENKASFCPLFLPHTKRDLGPPIRAPIRKKVLPPPHLRSRVTLHWSVVGTARS